MKPIYYLNHWAVVCDYDPYKAPEQMTKHLTGLRDKSNYKVITTSPIVNANGYLVETKNSMYILESPDPNYIQWCENNNIPFDSYNPIKIKNNDR